MIPEDDGNDCQFDHCGGDVEQQEVEHEIYALGAAFDDLGYLSRPPSEMEAQTEIVQPREHVFGQRPRCVLAHTFENHAAHVVESNAGETAQRICEHERQRDGGDGVAADGHFVDRVLVEEGQ